MANFLPTYNYEYSSDRKSELECRENITETLETQRFVEDIVKSRVPPPLDVETAKNQQTIASISKMQEYFSSSAYHQTENITNTYQAENTTNFQSDSCELRRPTHFSPNTVECTLPSRIENAVPLKWESALTQAIRTTAPDADTFAQIPSKSSHSAFASALSIAPSRPFTPTTTHDEAVPLPEETVPYMPPERPILPVRDEELKPEQAERPKSQFVRALETAPDTPHKLKDGVAPPIRKKTKDPAEKFLEELPKPQEKLSMLAALTTAPERPYSPLVVESIVSLEKSDSKTSSQFDKSQLHKPLKPDVLPDSFKINKKEPKPPTYYPPSVLYQKTQETTSEEQLEESESSKIRTIEKETIHNPEVTQVVVNEGQAMPQNFAPMFQGFSCSFQNKTEHSQFSVSVSTTPPVMSPPPKAVTTSVTTIENKPGYVQKEIITEEERKRQQSTKKHEQSREESRREVQERAKQAEEVIVKKPVQPVALHKAEYIPSYQVEISAEAEAQLQRMEKMEKAQIRLEQQKITTQQAQQTNHTQQDVNKPVIRIESEIEEQAEPHRLFRPLEEDRPPSRTFSPRPGSITPSNISKPPAVLPYYQANLVAQPMAPAPASLFDPKSPAVSRSPSPCLRERSRSPSPSPSLLSTKSNVRSVSPAAGPPPNPLKSSKPLPNPHDTKVNQARENLTTFIPEYKNKRELVEKTRGMDFQKRVEDSKPSQMYVSTIQTQNFPVQQQGDMIVRQEEMYDARKMDMSESHSSQKYTAQTDNTVMSTAVEEQIRQAHLEQMKKCQSESLERSADGRTQIQRKKIVTEEYERSQKETNIQIERNVTTTKKHPFQDVKAPSVEAPVVRGHLTDPQVLSSSIGRQKNVRDTAKTSSSSSASLTPSAKVTAADVAAPIKHVFAPSAIAPVKHVTPPTSSKRPNQNVISPSVSRPDTGAGSGRQTGGVSIAPKRGRGVLNPASLGGARIPLCGHCNMQIRGPFITALGKIWCPNHFICSTPSCRRPLQDLGFVEEKGQLYCEYCFEQYLAPQCSKCGSKIKGDCLKAIGKNFHPECFNCTYCGKLFGNSPFFLEDGSPYCEADWNELFTTKCFACGFPVEAGDRWVEALNNNYHSQCFNCTMCKKNLEGQSFFAKGGRPFCKNHAR